MAQADSGSMKAVINSTPLIALSMLNHLFVLQALFDEIFVPSSVYKEVVLKGRNRPGSQEVGKADWIIVKEPAESFPLPPELLGLDTGEMDVILLAREVKADWVLIDEKLARRVAKGVGLKVKGTFLRDIHKKVNNSARAIRSKEKGTRRKDTRRQILCLYGWFLGNGLSSEADEQTGTG